MEIIKKSILEKNETHRMFEVILGCKWSLSIFSLIRDGVKRPGQMEKSLEGLSTKVLNQCLKKSMEFNILEKRSFPEIPPRVEYEFTSYGLKFIKVLDEIDKLKSEF